MGRKPLTFRLNRREETASTQPKEGRSRSEIVTKGRKKQRASRPREGESRGEDEEPRRLMNRIKQSL